VKTSTESSTLLSVARVAEVLDCSRGHVINLVAKGHLRGVDIGIGRAKTRIRQSDLEAYIASKTR
jgi:excisionase family DNA binding protein